jgi:hypothetical protein
MSADDLYHYTTAEGLKGILEKQNLRATHYLHLNDSSEMGIFEAQILQRFFLEIRGLLSSDVLRFSGVNEFLLNQIASSQATMIYRTAIGQIDAISPLFMCSLCQHSSVHASHSGLLSQWRGYGASGGYCVVFDGPQLIVMLEKLEDRKKFASLQHKQVEYVSPFEERNLDRLDGLASQLFKSKFNASCGLKELDTLGVKSIPFDDGDDLSKLDWLMHMST